MRSGRLVRDDPASAAAVGFCNIGVEFADGTQALREVTLSVPRGQFCVVSGALGGGQVDAVTHCERPRFQHSRADCHRRRRGERANSASPAPANGDDSSAVQSGNPARLWRRMCLRARRLKSPRGVCCCSGIQNIFARKPASCSRMSGSSRSICNGACPALSGGQQAARGYRSCVHARPHRDAR